MKTFGISKIFLVTIVATVLYTSITGVSGEDKDCVKTPEGFVYCGENKEECNGKQAGSLCLEGGNVKCSPFKDIELCFCDKEHKSPYGSATHYNQCEALNGDGSASGSASASASTMAGANLSK